MIMETAVQQQTDSNGQTLVTPNERQALIQQLRRKWPLDLSTRIENQAFERSHGIKNTYVKFVQVYFHQVQTALQARINQQHQQITDNVIFSNPQTNLPQQPTAPNVNQVSHPQNGMYNQAPRFSLNQQPPPMNNPQTYPSNQMVRLREPLNFNPTPTNPLSYSQTLPSTTTTTTTIDLSQGYSFQQKTNTNLNDYSSLQSRHPIPPSMNIPRQRTPILNNHLAQQPTMTNTNDIVHQFVVGNPISTPMSTLSTTTATPVIHTHNSSTGDQLLQRILLSNIDGGSNKPSIPNRQAPPTVLSQPPRLSSTINSSINNSTNPLRTSLSSQQLSPSPSVVIIPPPTQTSTVQIQPSNNITIQQSPLNNGNGPFSANSQTVSTNNSTPVAVSYPSPNNRVLPLSGTGSILSPDNETLNLIKYLKENVNRLQLLTQKFTNEGDTQKLRQVQSIHQQIIQFINNPTYETLTNAKNFRDMLDRIPNRVQQPPPIPSTTNSQTNIFNQCLKATNDFLLRDQKERINVTKRYLEPLTDVINGAPHKMMRLDVDNSPTIKIRSSNSSSLLSKLNEEINQLPEDIYSIEQISLSRTRINMDNNEQYLNQNGIILRCKLLDKSNPIIPPLRVYITTSYPEQPPEILSLTKTMPPRLEFTDGHPFFDQVSSIFVSHLFKLPSQHTITEILDIWRQSVQKAL